MSGLRTGDFHYELPEELIAQEPARRRDESRLLVFRRPEGGVEHQRFADLPGLLAPGDLVVLNNSRVIPARLRGEKTGSGGRIEALLAEEVEVNDWWVMLRPGKRVRPGTVLRFRGRGEGASEITAEVVEKNEEGRCRIRFGGTANILGELDRLGEMPLPPYIERGAPGPSTEDSERYQTVFAKAPGSVAAPTAGLHFTPAIFEALKERGIRTAEVTLHVGLGTFAPVKADQIEEHRMHEERYELPAETAAAIMETKARGGRVVAAGTTSLRVLESAASEGGRLEGTRGRTRLFVYPPCEFKVVDALLTNFHLPESTLLMLASAFAAPGRMEGRGMMLRAYREAIAQRYRFFSYGDAMLIA